MRSLAKANERSVYHQTEFRQIKLVVLNHIIDYRCAIYLKRNIFTAWIIDKRPLSGILIVVSLGYYRNE